MLEIVMQLSLNTATVIPSRTDAGGPHEERLALEHCEVLRCAQDDAC